MKRVFSILLITLKLNTLQVHSQTVTDIDGNVYNTVKIGTQTWMKENLKTTKYRNGDAIPNIADGNDWSNLTTGAYCWYNNDEATNKGIYGALYNWYTVDDSRNICPSGWHVPKNEEWTTLTDYLGGISVAGTKLKETGTTHWNSPNYATNESGFTALPSGIRDLLDGFKWLGINSHWWSATEDNINTAYSWYVTNNNSGAYRDGAYSSHGFSIRCLKDSEASPPLTVEYFKIYEGIVGVNDNINIHPNPATDILKIGGLNKSTTARIYNTNGKLLLTSKLNGEISEINVSDIPVGVYVIELQTNKEMAVKRFEKL